MNAARMLEFFDKRVSRGESMVLATVFETRGSTYSKAGAHMLIDGNGVFQGMLSGGCLEGDLAIRAQVVLESNISQIATYDLAQSDDEVYGLGVGCDGMMRIFLQPLHSKNDYSPFSRIADVHRGSATCVVATIIDSGSQSTPAASGAVFQGEAVQVFGAEHELGSAISSEAAITLASGQSALRDMSVSDGDFRVLLAIVETPPRLLVLGGGPDAEPVTAFVAAMGWHCTVVDHRPAYIDNGQFSGADSLQIDVDALSDILNLDDFESYKFRSDLRVQTDDRNHVAELEQLLAGDIEDERFRNIAVTIHYCLPIRDVVF